MTLKPIAVLLAAACMRASLAAEVPCPRGASWCGDIHALPVHGEGKPWLAPASETASRTAGDYFVEARVRPAPPDGGTARRVYLIARWVDERNWLALELESPPGGEPRGLNIVRMDDGTLERIKKADIDMGAPGSYTTLRLDVAGGLLTMYANGNRINGAGMPPMPTGRIGVMAQGGGF